MDIDKKILKNQPLAPLTTYRIGGSARFFVEIKKKEDLLEALIWAKKKKLKTYLLGGGSNILFSDDDISGLVLHISNDEITALNEKMEFGAGVSLTKAYNISMENCLSGLEWSLGIPRATIGGAIRGNSGAFDVEMKNLVETVEVFNLRLNEFEIFSNRMCKFSYRSSLFKVAQDYIVWSTVLKLKPEDKPKIKNKASYALKFRKENYPKLPSAGSVFENLDPEYINSCNPEFFEKEIKNKFKREGRVGAGLIIDLAGLKGKKIGGVMVSREHANHLVNTGKGTAKDLVTLISFIKQQVRTQFKLQLREEISYFGFN